MLTSHQYNNPVRSGECEAGSDLPQLLIGGMVTGLVFAVAAVSIGMAGLLDSWWPIVAGAVADLIIVRTV